jgi:hypothetical protein
MTRKDYVLIAQGFADAKKHLEGLELPPHTIGITLGGWDYSAKMVAAAFAADNPRFDRERFLTACGVTLSLPTRNAQPQE